MNSSTINESAEVDEPRNVNFGKALLQARERSGYTIAEVAKATHLNESIIDAIEQSDMDRLPPPTFVQGYLRTYARHLELPEQKIVDDFNHAVPYRRVSQLQPRSTVPTQPGLHSPWVRSISIILGFLVLVALVYGGYGYYTRTAKNISHENASTITIKPADQDAALPASDQPAMSSVSKQGGSNTDSQETQSPAPMATDKHPVTTGQSSVSPSQTDTSNTAGSTGKNITSASNSSDNTTTTSADTGNDVLELTANDDSWVEISDADGHRLYHDLFRKGNTIHLKGKAPFDVFLGNAPAIDLRVNGAEVKMDGRIRSNKVAHFTVTTSEGNVVFR